MRALCTVVQPLREGRDGMGGCGVGWNDGTSCARQQGGWDEG